MKGKRLTEEHLISVTRLAFIGSLLFSFLWVTWSYLLATYAILRLGVVYTLEELSKPALTVLLGTLVSKVAENIFEHNDGVVFGKSKTKHTESEDTYGTD